MKAGGKPRGRRYAGEAQQEDRSEAQFRDRLAEPAVGWPVNRMGRDLGEDLLVQIYDQGTSTGLSFYVQLKSVRDADQRRRKRGPEELRYRLEVKDLVHWDVQTVPVVLVIWDVEKRSGYWQTIPEIIKALDEQSEGWRKKKTVTVSVPMGQGTDDDGLRRLRWALADLSLASIAGRSPFEMKLSFPGTEQGRESLRGFEDALDRGDPIVFEAHRVPEFKMPDWHRRLYGDLGQPARLEITPTPPKTSLPVRIEVLSREGSAALPYVDLLVTKQGRAYIELNNEHQDLATVCYIKQNESGRSTIRFRGKRLGNTVQEAREAAAFLAAMTRPGSRIRVSTIEAPTVLMDQPISAGIRQLSEWARTRLELLEKLAFIEPHIAKFGSISLHEGVSTEEALAIEQLYQICRERKLRRIDTFTFEVSADANVLPSGSEVSVDIQFSGPKIKLFGVEVPLGRVRRIIEDRERFLSSVRQAVTKARTTGKPVQVSIDDFPVTDEYLDWPRPADRLYDIASAQAGYFTLAQAAEAGFASAEQVETEQRVERCGGNVFRLAQFPPSEHEDLVILWLQTDQKGVFSHDTALALHQLSDILPSRRHITVPHGWEPPPDARLDQGTVLHPGEISPSEITWLSPVPLTKPLRTIRDCIEKGVSPEIIEQAIADAIQRGMITQAEAQGLQVASARSA